MFFTASLNRDDSPSPSHKRKRDDDESEDEDSSTEILSSGEEDYNKDSEKDRISTEDLFFNSIKQTYDESLTRGIRFQKRFIGELFYNIATTHLKINQKFFICTSSLDAVTAISYLKYAIAYNYFPAEGELKRLYFNPNQMPRMQRLIKKEFSPEEDKYLPAFFARKITKEKKEKLISSFAAAKPFLEVISDYIAYVTALFHHKNPQIIPKLFLIILKHFEHYVPYKTTSYLLVNIKIMEERYSTLVEEEQIRMNMGPSQSSGTLEDLATDEVNEKADNDKHVGFSLTASQTLRHGH